MEDEEFPSKGFILYFPAEITPQQMAAAIRALSDKMRETGAALGLDAQVLETTIHHGQEMIPVAVFPVLDEL